MNTLSITGILIQIHDKETIESKGKKWLKQTFLIDIGGEYNNEICFQLFGEEKTKLLENYKIGDQLEVFFNLSSKQYNNRYYHNIDAWKINGSISKNNSGAETKETDEEEQLPF